MFQLSLCKSGVRGPISLASLPLPCFHLNNAAIAGKFNDWIVCLFRDKQTSHAHKTVRANVDPSR
jgi:hypothetical protein